MSARICTACGLSPAHCLCEGIVPLQSRTRVLVLQHPDEHRHAKNTLRLARLALPGLALSIGEQAGDFADLQAACAAGELGRVALCYPVDTAASAVSNANTATPWDTLVFIDATWRKAHKLMMLNPWLQELPRLALAAQGDYRLRKTRVAGGLSTLEAIAWALEQNEAFDPAPLLALQARWIAARLAAMPAAVRKRYEH